MKLIYIKWYIYKTYLHNNHRQREDVKTNPTIGKVIQKLLTTSLIAQLIGLAIIAAGRGQHIIGGTHIATAVKL